MCELYQIIFLKPGVYIYDNTHLKYSTSIFLKRNEPLVSRKLKTLVEYGIVRVWELKRSVFISLGWHLKKSV